MVTIYEGNKAKDVCELILNWNQKSTKYDEPIEGIDVQSAGYWKDKENGAWVAFDNSTFDCWVDEFEKKKDAVSYANEANKMRCNKCMYFEYDLMNSCYDHEHMKSRCGLHGSAIVDPNGIQVNLDNRGSCGFHKKPIKKVVQLEFDF